VAINLEKGQTIKLDKSTNDLTKMTIGLGWKIKSKKGFFAKLTGGAEYDLDAIAIALDANDRIQKSGDRQLRGSDVIFFNNLRHDSGAIVHSGDNLVGGSGVQDDEQIVVHLDRLPAYIHRIVFVVTIYEGIQKKQHLGEVEKAFMRAVDGKGREIARYNLAEDAAYSQMCSVIFGELYRKDNVWKFRAIGDAHREDSFLHLLDKLISQ